MEHAVPEREWGRASRLCDQLTLDGERQAAFGRSCPVPFRPGWRALNRRLLQVLFCVFFESAAPRLARLRALPARRGVVRAEAFHRVEARGAVVLAEIAEAAFGFGYLDMRLGQLIEKSRRNAR